MSHCTGFNSDLSIGSRLDSFLISRDMKNQISSCEILPCANSDHLFSGDQSDLNIQSDLLENVSVCLSETDLLSCEGKNSLLEATVALNKMNRNKSPGPDGLTVEFYAKFWKLIGPHKMEVFNLRFQESSLCDLMKTSHTRLVFKKGDRKSLKNWRPISLLKC